MIEIFPDRTASCVIGESEPSTGTLLGQIFMPLTRYLRAREALAVITDTDSHLDIGCADCYLLLKSPCRKLVGLDLRFGDEVTDKLDFPDESFSNVTMLAVIEHLEAPGKLFAEISRVLKPGGMLIITTPKQKGEWAMSLLKKEASEIHNEYFDLESIKRISEGLFEIVKFKEFMLGVNQLFVLKKPE